MAMTCGILRLVLVSLFAGGVTVWYGVIHAADGDPAKGEVLYEKLCVACHGLQGKGDGPAAKTLVPPPSDLTSAASKKKSAADLRRTVEEGKSGTTMMAWKTQLSSKDITDVMAYVATLRK
jgi:mono/diheme cytochrome c family protein